VDFDNQYLAVTLALDADSFVEANELYVDLLKSNKDRIMAMSRGQGIARRIHYAMASQYALQKIVIQRIQGIEFLNLDFSLFTRSLPFKLAYDSKYCSLFKNWKDDSKSFSKIKFNVAKRYSEIEKKKLKAMTSPEVIAADVYVAFWVLNDFLDLETLLPQLPIGYANLGCGYGLFDAVYLREPRNTVPAVLIDIDPQSNPLVTHLAKLNDLSNVSFQETWTEDDDSPRFVLSIRSCGYMYSVETYDSLFRRLKPGSRVLLDVAHKLTSKTTSYFESLGASVRKHPRPNINAFLFEFIF
jgi:hypothetical protein